MMAGGQQKTSRSGARGQRGSTLSHQCLATLALATTVTRPAPVPSLRLVVLKRGNGASSGALYWGGLSRRAGSIRCSEGHARQPKTTPNSQRLRLSVVVSLLAVSPHSRPHAEEYYPGNTIALSGGNGEGRQKTWRPRVYSIPLISRNQCSTGVCTLPRHIAGGLPGVIGPFSLSHS